jgi:uncharacterized membrane protein YqjE
MIPSMNKLRSAGAAWLTQAALHGQLARIEWAEERDRLLALFYVALMGFACVLCVMIFTGVLILTLVWTTEYRIGILVLLIAMYGAGAGMAWRRIQDLVEKGKQSFSMTCDELAADAALVNQAL